MDQDKLAQLLLATFLEELQEHVAQINRELIALEKDPPPDERAELFTVLFRSAHTLKGSSRAVNAEPIEAACHQFEEVLTAVRDERIELTAELFSLLFAMADAIEETGMWLREEQDLTASPLNEVTVRLQQAVAGKFGEPAQLKDLNAASPSAAVDADRLSAEPSRAAARPEDLELASAGDQTSPPVDDHDSQISADRGRRPAAVPTVRVAAEKLDSLLAKSGELLISRRRVASRAAEVAELCDLVTNWKNEWNSVDKLLRQHKLLGDADQGDNRQSPLPRRAAALLAGNRDKWRQLEKRLDRLVSTIQADGRHLDTTCDALDDEVHQARMLPFSEACRGLERAARDVARQSRKQVEVRIEGDDVEIDRSVLEGLKDPLLHLVRNAVDHGLESADTRQQLGKPATGTITISAALRGTEVEVVVADDGGGVDLERVRKKVIQKGLPEPSDDAALLRMLFHPSFSTAEIVTDVSGRGVGLDVVQSTVETLHGTVQIAFEPGQGTQFIIRVPLTLTTIRTVLVAAGGHIHGFATSSVQQLVRFSSDQLGSMGSQKVLLLGDAPVPVATLVDVLGVQNQSSDPAGDKRLAVIVRVGEERAAFVVDEVLSEQEVVVQNLGTRIRRVRHVSGATLLASGRVALVLNVANVIRTALGTAPGPALAPDRDGSATTLTHRLLVADDSLTTRTLLRSILEAAGYVVEVAVDGVDAWQRIQASKPELVVSDVDMPQMNGFELTSTIRKSSDLSTLPVILITARQTDEDRTRGVQAGANAYFVKSSFDQHNLLETIAQLL